MTPTFRRSERTFESLMECVRHLHEQFAEPKDLAEPVRFLFRGESRLYATTCSTESRLAPALRQDIDQLRSLVLAQLSEFFDAMNLGGDAQHSNVLGFLQHYGFPTSLIDFTSNLLVAAYFASKGRNGLIGVLDIDLCSRPTEVIDLRLNEAAQRARTQHAFALSEHAIDLKTDAARRDLGMRWFRARVSANERRLFRELAYLDDSHFDVAAGLVTSSVYGVVRNAGRLADEVATFLSARLPSEARLA